MNKTISTTIGVLIVVLVAGVAGASVMFFNQDVEEVAFKEEIFVEENKIVEEDYLELEGEKETEEEIESEPETDPEKDEKPMNIKIPLFSTEQPSKEEIIKARGTERYVGCGDVVFYMEKDIPYTLTPLKVVYEKLFSLEAITSIDGKNYANAIYSHAQGSIIKMEDREDQIIKPLQFDKVVIKDRVAHVYLSGDYATVGTCEPPRTEAALKLVATQFDTVDNAKIYLNKEEMIFVHGGPKN